jgi:hypothetical protein
VPFGVYPNVPRAGFADDRRMDANTTVVRLELKLAGDTLTGRASDGSGAGRAFTGRLGLIAAIDALLTETPAAPGRSAGGDIVSLPDGFEESKQRDGDHSLSTHGSTTEPRRPHDRHPFHL